MIPSEKHQSLLNEANAMLAQGHDNTYIALQFADQGVDDDTINAVLSEIAKTRKAIKRRSGVKLLIYGLSFLGAALLFTFISYDQESPLRFVLWGLMVAGVMTTAKGVVNVIFG